MLSIELSWNFHARCDDQRQYPTRIHRGVRLTAQPLVHDILMQNNHSVQHVCQSQRRAMNLSSLKATARRIRIEDLKTVYGAGAGHIGGEMSVIDILTALYFHVLRVDPDRPDDPQRDRLVLSKGHTACALYVTLAERGFIEKEALKTILAVLIVGITPLVQSSLDTNIPTITEENTCNSFYKGKHPTASIINKKVFLGDGFTKLRHQGRPLLI